MRRTAVGIHWGIGKAAFSQIDEGRCALSYLKQVLTLVDARAPRNWRKELLINRSYSRFIQEYIEHDYNLNKSVDECAEWVLKSITEYCAVSLGK
jgi:hypothetical protein